MEEVNLSAFITKKTLAYYDVFQAANITLDFKVEDDLKMRTDENLLDRILQNLLGNVLKHGKEEARLSLRKEKEQLVLEIANLVKQPIKSNRKSQQPFLFGKSIRHGRILWFRPLYH